MRKTIRRMSKNKSNSSETKRNIFKISHKFVLTKIVILLLLFDIQLIRVILRISWNVGQLIMLV